MGPDQADGGRGVRGELAPRTQGPGKIGGRAPYFQPSCRRAGSPSRLRSTRSPGLRPAAAPRCARPGAGRVPHTRIRGTAKGHSAPDSMTAGLDQGPLVLGAFCRGGIAPLGVPMRDGSGPALRPAVRLYFVSGPEQNRTKTVQNRTETEQRWIGMGVQPCRRPERSGGLRQGCRCALALLRRRRAGKVPAMKTSNWSTAIPSDLSAASSKISTRVLSTPPLPPHIWG